MRDNIVTAVAGENLYIKTDMTKREKRVIQAFINCVLSGEYTFDYAIVLIEDSSKYGWLGEEAKEVFYAEFEKDDE